MRTYLEFVSGLSDADKVARGGQKKTVTASRRGEVGGKLSAGEVVVTATGRSTTPFPRIDMSTDKKAGREITERFREAITGLDKLFTPKNTLGSGLVFDEDTYRSAKPHFKQALTMMIQGGYPWGSDTLYIQTVRD